MMEEVFPKTSGQGESPAVMGEVFPTAVKGIPSPWGNPGFCNGAEVSAGEESLRHGGEVSSRVL